MRTNYFSIERDKQFPCFCQACLVGKTEEQMSGDYCKECYPIVKEKYNRELGGIWSEDGQVFFIDGYGWGVSRKGTTFCKGKEADIIKGQMTTRIPPTIATINVGARKRVSRAIL